MHPTVDLPGWTPILFYDEPQLASALRGKELYESPDGRRIFNAIDENGAPCYGAFVRDAQVLRVTKVDLEKKTITLE